MTKGPERTHLVFNLALSFGFTSVDLQRDDLLHKDKQDQKTVTSGFIDQQFPCPCWFIFLFTKNTGSFSWLK